MCIWIWGGGCQLLNYNIHTIEFTFMYLWRWASLVTQMVKNLPAMQKTKVWYLGQEDRLEESMTTHFSILAWRISWTEEPGWLQSVGSQRVRHDWWLSMHSHAKWREYFCDTLPFKCDDNSLHMGQRRSVTKLLSLRILWVKTIANTENQSHSSSMWSLQVTLNMGI